MSDDEVIHMGWQEEAFATIRERLESELARTRAVVDAATALAEHWRRAHETNPDYSGQNLRLLEALAQAVAALAPTEVKS